MLFPVTVIKQGKFYRCVCGNKRVRASILAGKKKIPCIEGIVCESDIYKAIETQNQDEKKELLNSLLKKHSYQKIATCLCVSTGELELLINKNQEEKQTEEEPQKTKNKPNNFKLIKDKRFFINSIRKAVDSMKESGFNATLSQKENSRAIEIKVNIKKSEEDFLQLSLPDFTA